MDDRTLATPYNQRRQKPAIAKGPVRYLLKPRHKVMFYKTYRGQHVSALRALPPRRHRVEAPGTRRATR